MNVAQVRGYLLSLLLLAPVASRADDLLDQSDFNTGVGLPWHISESAEENSDFKIADGVYAVTVNKATTNVWDVQIRHRNITLQSGHTYKISFDLKASAAMKVRAKIGQKGGSYDEYWFKELDVGTSWTTTSATLNANKTDATCEFAFHFGGQSYIKSFPTTLYFDNIHLIDDNYTKPAVIPPRTLPNVRVNQVGYLPNAQKIGTVISSSTSPLDWSVKDGSGTVIASGKTTPMGADKASEDNVHRVDFSSATTEGTGYTLVVGSDKSNPFDISKSVYSKMRKDVLGYFYQNRSGIAIESKYVERADLARVAGHPTDKVGTWPESGQDSYQLDVTGGWYDAGDHGKYVVNGGITVWTLLNMWERASAVGKTDQFKDGTLNIPEQSNSVPDILDEARWQLNFMLKMQVPEAHSFTDKDGGNKVHSNIEGMVHHKIHDFTWTALGVRPDQDTLKRYLRPVSTAATLNLAATAAQASRIWKTIDATFSTKCLTAAEKAWTAAVANPDIYAPNFKTGGGPYNDSYVDDDFYWAACELYVTTGKDVYLTYLKASPHYLEMPSELSNPGEDAGLMGCFTWGSTQGLGTISLALVKGNLPEEEVTKARNAIVAAADAFIAKMDKEGYVVPLNVGENGYPWGSNSFVLNDLIVMAYARDFTKDIKYLNGVTDAMDYILGRNAMDQCYVSGYGEFPLQNPHHRFWAYQSDPTFPKCPSGAVSGGPNSGLQDPWVQGSGWIGIGANKNHAPAKCYMDNIESWSTNEVTINWNVSLSWATAYLDENSDISSAIRHNISYNNHAQKFSPVVEARRNCLAISLGNAKDAKISIFNASGRVLYSEKVTQKTGKVIIGNNLYGKAAGLIIVNIQSKLGTFQNSFIVK